MKPKDNALIIGIDPAPSKRSTVFDGEKFMDKDFQSLARYIHGVKGNAERVLICWDAPLIDRNLENLVPRGKEDPKIPYYRELDRRLKQDLYDENNSKEHGASVMSFASCPHWTVSQFVLGLPRLGPHHTGELPYDLVQKEKEKRSSPYQVVEVHPAAAMYYWLDVKLPSYKGNSKAPEVLRNLKKKLTEEEKEAIDKGIERLKNGKVFSDDELDAFVAWCLGKRWMEGDGSVELFDDGEGAGMLLPKNGVERLRKT